MLSHMVVKRSGDWLVPVLDLVKVRLLGVVIGVLIHLFLFALPEALRLAVGNGSGKAVPHFDRPFYAVNLPDCSRRDGGAGNLHVCLALRPRPGGSRFAALRALTVLNFLCRCSHRFF